MITMTGIGPCGSQEPGTPSEYPVWMTKDQVRGTSAVFPGTLAQNWIGSEAIWNPACAPMEY